VDWIGDNPWVIWLAIAVVLVIVEMFSLELVLLMFAIGALAAALFAGLGAPGWLAIAVFAVVSVALLALLRPPLVARLHAGPTLTQGHDAQVGRRAVVVEPVSFFNGRVQLSGELWSARTETEELSFDTDDEVSVLRIDGATAVVGTVPSTSTTTQES
jgi:membrane protein implicated in regulation of membrane protease activity